MNEQKIESIEDNVLFQKIPIVELTKYLPVAYPIFIFLGYLNYDFYYRRFDIDIFNYLSINELLFSFISLSYPLIFLLVAQLSISVYNELMTNLTNPNNRKIEKESKKNKNNLDYELEKSFFLDKYLLAKRNWKDSRYFNSLGYFILSFILLLVFIIVLILPIAILYFGFLLVINPLFSIVNLKTTTLGFLDTPQILFAVVFGWFISYATLLSIMAINNRVNRKSLKFYLLATFFCLIISTSLKYQNIRSYNFLVKKEEKHVSFNYNDEYVKSSDKKKLLGITADYIFLRDNKNKTNYIFNLSDVKNLEITSVINNNKK